MKTLRTALLAGLVTFVALAAAPAASAEATCQDLAGNGTACISASTTGDPTTGSFGASASASVASGNNSVTARLCVVVFASCP